MEALAWIVGSSLLMSAIALVGSLMLVVPERLLQRLMLPLVAFAAGSLIGGAVLLMVPTSLAHGGSVAATFLWVLAGFVVFFVLEQLLHWHHCHRASAQSSRSPLPAGPWKR